jgi:ABC-2 type transport system ATP-binding protein
VRSPDAARLAKLIEEAGGTAAAGDRAAAGTFVSGGAPAGGPAPANGAGLLTVTGLDAARIGELAASAQIVLHELTPMASLEEAFMELTSGSLEFGKHEPDPVNASDGGAR